MVDKIFVENRKIHRKLTAESTIKLYGKAATVNWEFEIKKKKL